MLRSIRPKLTYANVMASLAFVLALSGGTAYAINEWTGANIQDGTLTGADVKGTNGTTTTAGVNGSLTGADISGQPAITASGQPAVNGSLNTYDIADGGLRAQDLQADALTGAQIKESSLGKVPDADTLDGIDSSRFASRSVSAVEPSAHCQGDTGTTPGTDNPCAAITIVVPAGHVYSMSAVGTVTTYYSSPTSSAFYTCILVDASCGDGVYDGHEMLADNHSSATEVYHTDLSAGTHVVATDFYPLAAPSNDQGVDFVKTLVTVRDNATTLP